MSSTKTPTKTDCGYRVCSYEDRPEAMDSVILMGESLCRVDPKVSLHLTVPNAPASVVAWARGRSPKVVLSTERPNGVSGWDVKPWLLLEQLDRGVPEALWLDADTIVTRPVTSVLDEFPRDALIVAEEWIKHELLPVTERWGMRSVRTVLPTNSSFVRATVTHQALLERWLEMTKDPRYREAQALPFERRPFHLSSDQVLLNALLGSEEFGQVSFDYIRLGRHIAHCAGSSGYRPTHRLLDLFRGLPPLIHCIGRKPWQKAQAHGRVGRFLTNLATDVSPYVLASREVARTLDFNPGWIEPRTSMGALFRGLTASHPGMAGLALATVHALHSKISQAHKFGKSQLAEVPPRS
jgi:hypothetical protein